MRRLSNRSAQWIFYLTAIFYIAAVFLRSILVYQHDPKLPYVLEGLLLWLVLFASEPVIANKWLKYYPFYLAIQTGLIFVLLYIGDTDFFASLFVILSMQIMLHLSLKVWAAWIALCALVTTLLLINTLEGQAFALALIYTAGNVFYGFYAQATRVAQTTRAENLNLAREVQDANQKLQEYSNQVERLVVTRERNRLARDLHDSVTQTVFSMTLTTQSAALLLERDPVKVESQLERLSQLARNALSEMQLLISELKPDEAGGEGLAGTLKRYLADGHFSEDLSISLDVQGEQRLTVAEEQNLFHIIQEALNNIVKHAQTSTARIRLHLADPMWIEVEDDGRGFDLEQVQSRGRVGLFSMRERADEVRWDLQIITSLGNGTRIRVEKLPGEERQI